MKVLIIDNHILFRQGLASLLHNEQYFEVVGEADTIAAGISKATATQPDLIIIDPLFPEGDGVEAVRRIAADSPQTYIVVLSTVVSDELLFSSIRAGASGCLQKNTPIGEILLSLQAVERGEVAISRRMISRLVAEFRRQGVSPLPAFRGFDQLTAREIEILIRLGRGASNHEISQELVISENTVKVHVHNIIKKLNLRNRREAGRLAHNAKMTNTSAAPSQPDHKIKV